MMSPDTTNDSSPRAAWLEWITAALFVFSTLTALIAIAGSIFPRTFPRYLLPNDWGRVLISLGLLLFLVRTIHIILNHHERRDFLQEFRFLAINARTAWAIGIGLGSICCGLYLMLPSTGGEADRFQGIWALYLGTLGATLGVHAFYAHRAPITDVFRLVHFVVKDLRDAKDNSRIWFVYPALALGAYDVARYDIKTAREGPHKDLQQAMQRAATALTGGYFRTLTYPPATYDALFEAIDRQCFPTNNTATTEEHRRAALPARESRDILRRLVEEADKYAPGTVEARAMAPSSFPPGVIVIDNIVYVLVTYGLPLGTPSDSGATFIPLTQLQGGDPVDVIAFRQRDPTLARTVRSHLEQLWEHATLIRPEDLGAVSSQNKPTE